MATGNDGLTLGRRDIGDFGASATQRLRQRRAEVPLGAEGADSI